MTIEAQCASCSHRSVCSKMDEYKDMVIRLTEVLGEFSEDLCKVEIKCRYYASDGRNELSNMFRGASCITDYGVSNG